MAGAGNNLRAVIRPSVCLARSAVQPLVWVLVPRSQSNNAAVGMGAPVVCSSRASTDANLWLPLPESSSASTGDQRIRASTLPMGLSSLSSPCSAEPFNSKPAKNACGVSLWTCRLIRPAQGPVPASFKAMALVLWAQPAIKVIAVKQQMRLKKRKRQAKAFNGGPRWKFGPV
jgi:hypothetical protein